VGYRPQGSHVLIQLQQRCGDSGTLHAAVQMHAAGSTVVTARRTAAVQQQALQPAAISSFLALR
jgi:hypothetical protein